MRAALLALALLLALAPGAAAQGLHLAGPLRRAAARLGARARRRDGRPSPRGRRCAAPAAATRGTYGRVYYKSKAKRRWQVSFFAPPRARTTGARRQLSETVVDDRSGRVLESWTGYKVEWTMARGYAGRLRRGSPTRCGSGCRCARCSCCRSRARRWRLLHLDLAVLLAFSVSYAFFNAVEIGVSVPLVYPLLVYLLARMLGIALSRARGREPPPLRLTVPGRGARDRGGVHPRLPQRASTSSART